MRQFSTSRSKQPSVVFRSADHDEQQTVTGDKFKNTVRKNPIFLQNIGTCIFFTMSWVDSVNINLSSCKRTQIYSPTTPSTPMSAGWFVDVSSSFQLPTLILSSSSSSSSSSLTSSSSTLSVSRSMLFISVSGPIRLHVALVTLMTHSLERDMALWGMNTRVVV